MVWVNPGLIVQTDSEAIDVGVLSLGKAVET
jgi:hypothetical protein